MKGSMQVDTLGDGLQLRSKELDFNTFFKGFEAEIIRDIQVNLLRNLGHLLLAAARTKGAEGFQAELPAPVIVSPRPRRKRAAPHRKEPAGQTRFVTHYINGRLYRRDFVTIFQNRCGWCGESGGATPAVVAADRKNQDDDLRRRIRAFFLDLRKHGEEYVRDHYRLVCRGCLAGRKSGGWKNAEHARAVVLKAMGTECSQCHTSPRVLGSVLLLGPEQPGIPRLKAFMRVLTTEGEAAVRRVFKILCRGCVSALQQV